MRSELGDQSQLISEAEPEVYLEIQGYIGTHTLQSDPIRVTKAMTPFTLGRQPDQNMRFNDPKVSRTHAVITYDEKYGWLIEYLFSP